MRNYEIDSHAMARFKTGILKKDFKHQIRHRDTIRDRDGCVCVRMRMCRRGGGWGGIDDGDEREELCCCSDGVPHIRQSPALFKLCRLLCPVNPNSTSEKQTQMYRQLRCSLWAQ